MNKFLAKLMFHINIENGSEASQFDEQVRIIESNSLAGAFYKARAIGKQEEETFLNAENKLIQWQFIDVAEVYPIDTIKDGEQVYSNTHRIKDTSSFINYIRQKSMVIQTKNLTFV